MKVSTLRFLLRDLDDEMDIMLMVPNDSGRKGHVNTFRLSDARTSQTFGTLATWTERILILEGK